MRGKIMEEVIRKIVLILTSLKAWGLAFVSITSFILAYKGTLSGEEWSTTIIATYGILYSLREYSKKNDEMKFNK